MSKFVNNIVNLMQMKSNQLLKVQPKLYFHKIHDFCILLWFDTWYFLIY